MPVKIAATPRLFSPIHLFLVVLGIIFVAEGLVMLALDLLPLPNDFAGLAMFDAVLLTGVSAPFIWAFVVRPLRGVALAESAHASTVVANASEGIVTVDGRDRISTFNPAAEHMFNLPATKAVGRPWEDFLTAPLPPVADADTDPQDGEPSRQTNRVETTLRRFDGTTFEAEIASNPLPPAGARAYIIHDISKRKAAARALSESRNMLQLVLDSIPVRVFWKDTNLVYLGCNGQFAKDAGLERPEQIVGKNDFELAWFAQAELYRADDRDVIGSGIAKLDYEEPQTLEDGSAYWLQTSKVPLTDAEGAIIGVMGCYADITQRKKTEEALEQTLTHLERRVNERTRDLEAAKEEAERANQAKSAFLSRISHELRTPLNAMLGFAQLLGSNPDEPLSPTQRHQTEEILRAGEHLLDLVNEVLDITRIESGSLTLDLSPVALGPLLTEVVTLLAPLARSYDVAVEMPQDCKERGTAVQADPIRLREVLLNLISNAIKYNRPGGRVEVRCRKPERGMAGIEVADTGIGIPTEKQARLFEPFERLGAEQSRIPGTGIGLTITRSLIEVMKGRIELESTPDQGSVFRVVLPRATMKAKRTRPGRREKPIHHPEPDGAHPPRTILYIEDNAANIELVRAILDRRPDLVLHTAARGKQGLAVVGRSKPDVILLDMNLPDMNGHDVLEKLAGNALTRNTPVIVVSANSYPEDVKQAQRLGVCDYISKPFSVRRLLSAIDAVAQPKAKKRSVRSTDRS